jgi:hypothetical protein
MVEIDSVEALVRFKELVDQAESWDNFLLKAMRSLYSGSLRVWIWRRWQPVCWRIKMWRMRRALAKLQELPSLKGKEANGANETKTPE